MRVVARCPAKINPFLAVGPPDASGYHPIRAVFQAVSLFDVLTIEDAAETTVACDWTGFPQDSTIHRALRYASELVDLPALRIAIEKAVPAESGLGGGSSDAAGLLRALRRFTQPRLNPSDELAIARAVGADVPFFLVGGRARGAGYGDEVAPLPDGPEKWLVIARPSAGVSTASAYGLLDARPRPWRDFPDNGDELYNDFERVAPRECMAIGERLASLRARRTLLCGSGSAVFGECIDQAEARSIAGRLRDGGVNAWAVRTLTREESLWTSSS